jgi:hypothetical protein
MQCLRTLSQATARFLEMGIALTCNDEAASARAQARQVLIRRALDSTVNSFISSSHRLVFCSAQPATKLSRSRTHYTPQENASHSVHNKQHDGGQSLQDCARPRYSYHLAQAAHPFCRLGKYCRSNLASPVGCAGQ